ncbi:hypothetical protein SeMB42_g03323 [Synchytrium endobioticum]|uniref:Uncharacterized protein n=1 Tax=Synchytrium endobioticum TaxID=286115 RepID=A0A507D7F5_9FUNG|nr:hypothetical protein SeMB42_g03323 [Synchytrium endobioticum]
MDSYSRKSDSPPSPRDTKLRGPRPLPPLPSLAPCAKPAPLADACMDRPSIINQLIYLPPTPRHKTPAPAPVQKHAPVAPDALRMHYDLLPIEPRLGRRSHSCDTLSTLASSDGGTVQSWGRIQGSDASVDRADGASGVDGPHENARGVPPRRFSSDASFATAGQTASQAPTVCNSLEELTVSATVAGRGASSPSLAGGSETDESRRTFRPSGGVRGVF